MQRQSRIWSRTTRTALGVAFGSLVATGAQATILVDCDTPDDFCVGDPCVTTDSIEITVASCMLDFSPRALVLAYKVDVPNGGTLSLTAGSIEVDKVIDGKHVSSVDGDGAHVSLIASGNIVVDKKIDVSGNLTNGTILVDAGANVSLNQRLRARAKGAGATAIGGTVTVQADGTVSSTKKGKIEVRGKKNATAAGAVNVAGQGAVSLAGRIDARGTPGGSVTIGSAAGTVSLSEEIRAGGETAAGGTVMLTAAADIFGGTVTVSGDNAAGGSALMSAGGLADVTLVLARGSVGGTVNISAGDISMFRVSVRGKDDAGIAVLTSTTGNVVVENVDGPAHGTGGQIEVDSAGDVMISDVSIDGGAEGGTLGINAAGNVVLGDSPSSKFVATGPIGGEIEATAAGNLTAQGQFRAAVGGCIGLSADLVLDTSGATFDVPLTASCL